MKQHMWGRLVIVALIVLFILPSLSPAQMIIEQINEAGDVEKYELKYCVTFSKDDIIFGKLMGYDTIQLKDGTCINDVGKPMMPAMEIKIALPAGMAVKGVRVVDTESVDVKGEYNVYPAQPPRRTDGSDDDTPFVEPDVSIYNSKEPYPSMVVDFAHQTDLAGQGIAEIRVNPLQYTPNQKKLTLYTSITFVIVGVDGYVCGDYLPSSISEKGRETYEEMIKDMVVNPEDVTLNTYPDPIPIPLSLPSGGPYDHVIITSTSYQSYFDDLIEWHTKRGLRDTVVTTSYIYSNYGGSDNQEKIRNFIIDAHGTWGTQYFLMGGEHGTVPFEYRDYGGGSTPSDQYYSDYDDDWTHEVYVGRASISSSTQANTFINKVINYEKNPPLTDYILDALLIGMDADASTDLEDLKENIDGSTPNIPVRFDVTKVYDSHGGNHETNTKNALNAGQNLVNHADHGWFDYLGTGDYNHGWGLSNSEIDVLTNNGKPSIIVSLACDPNGMDDPYGYDCIAEHFVIYNPNQAGVAFNGNTRSGYYYQGQPISLSGTLDRDWWRAVFDYYETTLGGAINRAKHLFSHSNNDKKHCEWTFNLLGEPAMPIWTDTPSSISVSHPSTLPTGTSTFLVDTNVPSAYICLWKDGDVYLTGTANGAGDYTFYPDPSNTGTMYVTVTKHNYLPYEGSTEVTEASFTIDGDVFESGGVIPVPDPMVTITNLVTEEEWTATVESGSNYYSLELTGAEIPSVGDDLRIMAKKELDEGEHDPDGYTYSIKITEHGVTQTEINNGEFTEDLNLDHYCINYFPDYPYHIKEQETYSGAAVMQMWTDFKSVGPYVQDDLQTWGLSNNTDEDKTAGLQHIDPRGMAMTLRWLVGDTLPPGHTFVVGVMPGNASGLNWAMHRICWWQYTGPGALPTGGNYENWMSVRGIHTDKRPQDGQYAGLGDWGYDVYGFWINDPDDPGGIGENSYKTADTWTTDYYTTIIDPYNTNWDGKYITVLEPPPEYDAEVTIVPAKPRFTKAITPIMMAKPVRIWSIEKTVIVETIKDKEALDIVKAAIDGVTEELLPYDQDFAETFAKTIAGEPLYVNDDNGDYYIVPFNIPMQKIKPRLTKCVMFERMGKDGIELVYSIDEKVQIKKIPIKPIPKTRTLIVVIVDAEDGHFKEASWVANPAQYLPISDERALEIVFESMKTNVEQDLKYVRDITIELVHRDSNPYYPDWKITIKNRVFYVGQDGTVS